MRFSWGMSWTLICCGFYDVDLGWQNSSVIIWGISSQLICSTCRPQQRSAGRPFRWRSKFAWAFIMTTTTSVASIGESRTSSRAADRRRLKMMARPGNWSEPLGRSYPTDATRRKRAVQAIETIWFLSIATAVASRGFPGGKSHDGKRGGSADLIDGSVPRNRFGFEIAAMRFVLGWLRCLGMIGSSRVLTTALSPSEMVQREVKWHGFDRRSWKRH